MKNTKLNESNKTRGEFQLQSSSSSLSSSRSIQQQHSPSSRRREIKGISSNVRFSWIASNRLVLWLILITFRLILDFLLNLSGMIMINNKELKGLIFILVIIK